LGLFTLIGFVYKRTRIRALLRRGEAVVIALMNQFSCTCFTKLH
jgi:hypothetical protein